jgi:arsenate reductase (thioredoxin)
MWGIMSDEKVISVLFVCTGNSCRSPMAEGLLKHLGGNRVKVMSAGSHPAERVNPHAVEVMEELGIDISGYHTKSILSLAHQEFDWVITLCEYAKESCPVFYNHGKPAKVLHWSIKDPHSSSQDPEELLINYREARDEIETRIKKWLEEQGLDK